MEPPSYMRSLVDRNVVMRRMTNLNLIRFLFWDITWRKLAILSDFSGQAVCPMKAFEDETFVWSGNVCNHLQY